MAWKWKRSPSILQATESSTPQIVVDPSNGPSTTATSLEAVYGSRFRGQPPSIEELATMMTPFAHGLELDEQIEAAGETHHVKAVKKLYRHHSMPITTKGSTLEDVECYLIPEPWNEHDPNAVAIVVTSWHVGYVPADMAPTYSRRLLAHASRGQMIGGVARVWAKSDGGVVRARVTAVVPEAALI